METEIMNEILTLTVSSLFTNRAKIHLESMKEEHKEERKVEREVTAGIDETNL